MVPLPAVAVTDIAVGVAFKQSVCVLVDRLLLIVGLAFTVTVATFEVAEVQAPLVATAL